MAVKITIQSEFNDKGVKASIKSMEDFNRAAKIAGGGFSGYAQVVGRMSQQVGQNVTRTGETLTKNLTLPLAAAAAGLYKATQNAADDAQAQVILANALKNTTGATKEQVASVEDWITAQGKALGVADDELRPALATLAGSFKDIKAAQAAASLSMDIAAARGVPVEQAAKAIAKAYAGQTTALARLVPGISLAALKSKDFGKISQEVAGIVGGQATAAANTQAGAMKRNKVAFDEAIESIGYSFMPIMQQLNTVIQTQIVPAIQKMAEWFEKLSPGQKKLVVEAGLVLAALGPVAIVLGKVTSGIGSVVVALSKAPAAFANVAKAARALYAVLAANPWILIATAVAIAVVLIIKNWDKVKAFLLAAWNAIKSAASTVWNAIVGIVKGAAGKVWDAIQAYFNFYKRVAEFGLRIVEGLWDGIKNAAGWIKQKLSEFAGGVLDSLKSAFGIASPSKKTEEQGKNLGYGLLFGLQGTAPAVKKAAKKVADDTLKSLKEGLSKTGSLMKNVTGNLKSALEGALSSVQDQMSTIYDDITSALQASRDAANEMVSQAQDRWQTAADSLGELKQQAKDFAGSIRDSLRAAFSLRNALNTENGGSFLGNLRDQFSAFKTFAGQIGQLRSMGLNESSMQEIIQAGVEQGTQIAAAILAGGSGAVREINQLESMITNQAQGLGDLFAQDKFGAQLDKARQAVDASAQSLANAQAAAASLIAQIDSVQAAADKILGKGMTLLQQLVATLGAGTDNVVGTIGSIIGAAKTQTAVLGLDAQLASGLKAGIGNLSGSTSTTNKTVNVNAGAVQINVSNAAGLDTRQADVLAMRIARELAAR